MVDLDSNPKPIQSIYTWYRENKLIVNRRYQRKLVWTLVEKQKLIESVLKQYPIPAILIADRNDAPFGYEIIDGLQRLQAIMSFLEGSFPTLRGDFFDIEHFVTAREYMNKGEFAPCDEYLEANNFISSSEVGDILSYNLALSIMRNASNSEVNDVFDRINSFGRRLSDQERRQAGVQNNFSDMVRSLACDIRGDAGHEILMLYQMRSISIDLPKTKHGYSVKADDVFWVNQGVIRSTDLRDSLDEQCIADIAACIVGGNLIERNKDALDKVYDSTDGEYERISNALKLYDEENFMSEFKYCIGEITKVCEYDTPKKLRDLIYKKRTNNSFTTVFSVLFIAFHEIIKEGMRIHDYLGVKRNLENISNKLETGRDAVKPAKRRDNIEFVKNSIRSSFIETDTPEAIYVGHTPLDIRKLVLRSAIELQVYELKQGILNLDEKRDINNGVFEQVNNTIVAIANNGPKMGPGKIVIGVANKEEDANRIQYLDGIVPKEVGNRFIVGVQREVKILRISLEDYVGKWTGAIRKSKISQALRNSVSVDYHDFYGLGVIVITVPPQQRISYADEELETVYKRVDDKTCVVKKNSEIVEIAGLFT